MQIKAGQYYHTRGGQRAFVAAVEHPFHASPYPIIGYISCDLGGVKWACDGRFCNSITTHQNDLIAEWKEPVTVTRWLALWSDGTISSHTEQPRLPLSNLLALKQVSITEGEGM